MPPRAASSPLRMWPQVLPAQQASGGRRWKWTLFKGAGRRGQDSRGHSEGRFRKAPGLCVRRALSPVLAVDVFDKFNFTGARVPRLEDIQDEVPRELESSVSFPADVFRPPERKGKVAGHPLQPGHPSCPVRVGGLPWGSLGVSRASPWPSTS